MIDKEFMMSKLISEYIGVIVDIIEPLSVSQAGSTVNSLLTKERLLLYFRERGLFISEKMAFEHCERYLRRYRGVTKQSIMDRAGKI